MLEELKKKEDAQFTNILVNKKIDYLYKLFFAYPISKKIGRYRKKRRRSFKHNYTKRILYNS